MSGLIRGLECQTCPVVCFYARDCRVETPGNDSLRLQLLQRFWTQLCKRVVNILPLRVVTCSRVLEHLSFLVLF